MKCEMLDLKIVLLAQKLKSHSNGKSKAKNDDNREDHGVHSRITSCQFFTYFHPLHPCFGEYYKLLRIA